MQPIKSNDFINNIMTQGFIPHITKQTRITYTTATLIDHLYSKHTHTTRDSGIIVTDMTNYFGIFHLISWYPHIP